MSEQFLLDPAISTKILCAVPYVLMCKTKESANMEGRTVFMLLINAPFK